MAGDMAACNTRDELSALSLQRDRQLAQACSSQPPNACNDLRSEAISMGNKVFTTASGYTYAVSPTLMALNPSTIGAVSDPRTGTFHDAAARSLAEGLLLETGNQVLGAVLGVVAREAILLGKASMNVTVGMLENMALRNVQVGAISNLRTAETVNATMKSIAGWEPAWKSGTVVADVILKPGSRVNMVVDETAWIALTSPVPKTERAFGGWATYDNVASQAYARNQLAITPLMKENVGYVIEVEITRPIYAQVGVVGGQGAAVGGGNQLHFIIPPSERTSTFKFISGKALP